LIGIGLFGWPYVPHQFDRMSNLYMHIDPALVTIAINWYKLPGYASELYESPIDLYMCGMLFYAIFALISHGFLFGLLYNRWRVRGYANSFMYF
jgi:hypothetical protein